ncbi:unnamed protein product [Ranitomeya imitator]|uniref:Uncharacterized protein n=1 Tax=Ranitomeya imitator TaxID=111125 RepID=A0ABN9LVR2_9NEOB|nr:unnamed protein product [Ranitomeya imitator]
MLNFTAESSILSGNANCKDAKKSWKRLFRAASDYDIYGVYPAIDACVALIELIHIPPICETLEHAIDVSKCSITSVAMLEMTSAGREMTDEELRA